MTEIIERSIFTIASVLLASASHADEWTTPDTYRQATFLAVDAMDWAQTRNIARHPDKWTETNEFLGNHPNVASVDRFFITMALINTGVAYSLPADYRHAFQYLSIGYEASYVRRNLSLGIGIEF